MYKMCGFTGFTSSDSHTLKKMSLAVKQRAKDNESYFYDTEYSLYHAHLKISDLDKDTNQPYISQDSIVSFVGELYNQEYLCKYIAIKNNISEVALIEKLYKNLGKNFVDLINGEFAISIYDKTKKELYLYRDRYGTKNVYYYYSQGILYFSSEIGSLIHSESKLNKDNLYQHLIFGFGVSPHTLVDKVYSLSPGKILRYNKEGLFLSTINTYHSRALSSSFLKVLEQAIKRRIPKHQNTIFISLSGGLDSSIIAYFLKKHFHGKIIAYSFLSDKNKGDVNIAQYNTQILGIEHHIIKIKDTISKSSIKYHEGLVSLPNLYSIIQEQLPQYKNIKVEFGGDGKEELFQINSNFDKKKIIYMSAYIEKKTGALSKKITQSFLHQHMLDYNLQMIDKMSLRQGIERRMPFLDYELLRFKNYKNFNSDMQDVLLRNGLRYSKKKYAYSDGIGFSYTQKEKDILQNAKYLLKYLKNQYT